MANGRHVICFCFVLICFKAEAQVHLQTGAAQYSLPLFGYMDVGNRLNTGISLNYISGNGIRANEVTSSVGAGWGLDIGGVITRIQNGEPDDQKQEGSFPNPHPSSSGGYTSDYVNYRNYYYPDGYMYSSSDPSIPVDNGGGYTVIFPSLYLGDYLPLPQYLADREQDQYMFTFGGYHGTFVIGKNQEVKLLVDSKLKVDFVTSDMTSSNIITRISEFHITDPSGIQYIFKDKELGQVIEYKRRSPLNIDQYEIFYPGTSPSQENSFLTGDAKNWFVTSKWHLSEIKNPLTGIDIQFEYSDNYFDMNGARTGFRSVTDSRSHITFQVERKKGLMKRIRKIKCNNKEEVNFVYTSEHRQDLTFDSALSKIEIVYDGLKKYIWNFSYGYMVDDEIRPFEELLSAEDAYRSRLCLLELSRSNPGTNESFPPYVFDYYIGETPISIGGQTQIENLNLAPPFTFYQDSWGFPNLWAFSSDDLNIPVDELDYSNIDWGMVWAYAEASQGRRNSYGNNKMAGLLKSIKNPYGGRESFEFEANIATLPNGSQKTVGGYRVKKTILYDGISHDNDVVHEYHYNNAIGLSSGWGYEEPVYQTTVNQRIYDCVSNGRPGQVISRVASNIPSLGMKAGIQLATNGQGRFNSQSGGPVGIAIKALMIDAIIAFFNYLFAPNYVEHTSTIQSYYSTSESNPLPFQYSRVVVENKLGSGSTGTVEHTFTSNEHFPIDVSSLAVSNSKRPRFAMWAYGKPLSVIIRDKDNNLKSKTEFTYSLIKNTLTDNNFVSQKWEPSRTTYDCNNIPNVGTGTNLIDHDIYYPFYGRIELIQKKEYVYNDLGDFSVLTSSFEYSPSLFQLRKSTSTNAKNEVIETSYYYAGDYTLSGVVGAMNTSSVNMATMPVASQTVITKGGSDKYLISGTATEYGYAANGDIKPLKNYVARMDQPVSITQAGFSSTSIVPGTNLYEPVSETIYSLTGMPSTIITDDSKFSTLYDYQGRLPIATVQNSDISNVAYTSFEADGGGGWTFNHLRISQEFSVTGKKSLKAGFADGGTSISRNISSERQYVLSFWLKGELPLFSGAQYHLRKSYMNEATGFTYYEYLVTNGTGIHLTNLGGTFPSLEYKTFVLDEIRLFPVEAMMTTVTYDPVWGKIAESDVNGRISYYDYDGLGRLLLIRDQDRNVIKTFEYNYKD